MKEPYDSSRKRARALGLMNIIIPLAAWFLIYTIAELIFREALWSFGSTALCNVLSAAVTLPFMIYFARKAWREVYFGPKTDEAEQSRGKRIILALAYIAVIIAAGLLINFLLTNYLPFLKTEAFYEARNDLFGGELFMVVLSNAVLNPIVEELLYRGTILRRWSGMFSDISAVIVSSVLFGLFHFNLAQFIYAFICGIVIGIAYVRTRSLLVPVIGHCLLNFIVIMCFSGLSA